ncbi:MAG: nitroreductase family protein [Phycisphaerales bacterium]|nr:nitroreductase family protein [Phycisphaerales bacterium]
MAKHVVSFDLNKCKRKGECVAVCGSYALEKDPQGFPRKAANYDTSCISCGQCVAVCSTGAVTLADLPAEPDFAGEMSVSEQQLRELYQRRRSVRHWADKPVDHDTLQRLLDAVRWAPTGMNRQGVKWLVINSKAEVRRLTELMIAHFRRAGANFPTVAAWDKGIDRILRDAPALVIAYGADEPNSPATDCLIALTHVDIAASVFGLGTCWAGYFMMVAAANETVRNAIGLPPGHKMYGALMMGYPKYHERRAPGREPLAVMWR